MKPEDIEKLSFQIIDQEAGEHNFSPQEWNIVRRMIHTSADFEYMKTVRFHPEAVQRGISALRSGKHLITDTEMARVGIRRKDAERFGSRIMCFIQSELAAEYARETGTTRASAAVDEALPFMKGVIYVVGNAPTALFRLLELIKEKKAEPSLIIGLPVGFVNAAESKAALIESNYPYISNVGRKGGSNLAASVVNALIKMAIQE
jgi:precorrin-8X/cobalt-precorrin-8 methylmutase